MSVEAPHYTDEKGLHSESEESSERPQDAYILGGADLEMRRIQDRLQRAGAIVLAGMTTWEKADIAERNEELEYVQEKGYTPVLIEHRGADGVDGVVHIDHHGENVHRDAAITQVLERLGIEPNFIDDIIAANDSNFIPGMEELLDTKYKDRFIEKRGADAEARYEKVRSRIIEAVRKYDRQAQGVTQEMEDEAVEAIKNMEDRDGLKIVSVSHHRTSPVTDRMYGQWEDGRENLVVVCASELDEKEVWFYGRGDVAKQTMDHFKGLKQERIAADPNEPERRGIYHTVGGGKGFGEADADARCLVVTSDPEEVIEYVLALENGDIPIESEAVA